MIDARNAKNFQIVVFWSVALVVAGGAWSWLVNSEVFGPETLESKASAQVLGAFALTAGASIFFAGWLYLSRVVLVAPGGWMRGIASFFCSKTTYTQVYEPLLADMIYEWQEAMIAGRLWKARWTRVSYGWYFVLHFIAHFPLGVAKTVLEIWKLM